MKFINLFCRTVAMFVMLLSVCGGLAICGERGVGELYTVKINEIPFRRDVAAGVLLRINCNYASEGIRAYDNVKKVDILLTEIEKNMDISIEGCKLLSKLSDLYKNRFDKNMIIHHNTTKTSCVHNEREAADICIDKVNDRVSFYLFY
ncbi:MAG: hypothetical protein LBB06_01515 [Endomicrobium sp.]|jgi:hypothetical protein|nr:hypothetical protein [Endomicrobium sp.]